MELELISKDKNSIEFFIKGERHTLPALLKDKLDGESSVEFVSYRLDHPLGDKSRFYLKTNGKEDPKKAIESACSEISKQASEFSDKLKKLKA